MTLLIRRARKGERNRETESFQSRVEFTSRESHAGAIQKTARSVVHNSRVITGRKREAGDSTETAD